MRPLYFVLVPLIILSYALDADAGILGKKTKHRPEDRVPELIETLKSSLDDHKRSEAAEELGQYDAKAFPEIIPTLIEALRNDASNSVRREAAKSIGELRPYFQQAGYALEMAAQNDPARPVRLAATTSLNIYFFLGYRSTKSNEAVPIQSQEPPLATPIKTISAPTLSPNSGLRMTPLTPTPPIKSQSRPVPPLMMNRTTQTDEPPLLPPPPPKLLNVKEFTAPLPKNEPFRPLPKPPSEVRDEGPALTPPK